MKILFRVDSSRAIGFGHTKRCDSLAATLILAHEIHWIQNSNSNDYIIPENTHFYNEVDFRSNEEIEFINKYIKENDISLIIFDSYEITSIFESMINCKYKMAFDDLGLNHSVNIILNQNSKELDKHYKSLGANTILSGPEFSIVDGKFFNLGKKNSDEIDHILVSFGGTDLLGCTFNVVKALYKLNIKKITVLLSDRHKDFRSIEEMVGENFQVLTYSENIHYLMLHADLFIGAYGSMTWERFVIGLPGLCFQIADNQKLIKNYVDTHNLGWSCQSNDEETWMYNINEIINNISDYKRVAHNISHTNCGNGAIEINRVINALEESYND